MKVARVLLNRRTAKKKHPSSEMTILSAERFLPLDSLLSGPLPYRDLQVLARDPE